MTAPLLTSSQQERAVSVARQISAAFRSARLAHRDRQSDVAEYLGLRSAVNVVRFEQAATPNVMLGTAIRMLSVYGLTLTVVPIRRNV